MRALGHFLVFVAFFLVFAAAIALCLLGATLCRSTHVLLLIVPVSVGLWLVYVRCCRLLPGRTQRVNAR